MGGKCEADSDRVWPDGLKIDDRLTFDGNKYVVVGTGPAEATLEHAGSKDYQLKVFRWAFTGDVALELKTDFSQEEFVRSINTDTEQEGCR